MNRKYSQEVEQYSVAQANQTSVTLVQALKE
jgi:hypothetical protein